MAIIGIDLGTTNSLAACFKGETAELILNRSGEVMTPSVVGIDDDGSLLVGTVAKARAVMHSDATVRSFKRFMGTDKKFSLGNKTYTATELSAMVLKKIKEDVEYRLGEKIDEAVITVPAYFNDNQRSATKKAATLAGLNVQRLINEPSAAALAYRMEKGDEDTSLLVFDFGGGTLDISLVECFDNIIEIIAIVGDNHLGGDDIDLAIAKYCCEREGITFESLDLHKKAALLKKSEEMKLRLSKGEQEETITEEILFEICMPLFAKIRNLFVKILRDSSYNMGDIADIIMVGGSSNLPVVKRFIKELLRKEPVVVDNADYAIALGVGTYAGIRERNEDIKDMVLTDVCPFTLGVDVINYGNAQKGRYLPIIERNATLPCSRKVCLTTTKDYQTLITINIYQGEEYYAEDNLFLGKIEMNIPSKRAGEEGVEVTYTYDINGILHVEVVNSRNVKKELLIANRELSEEEKERIAKEFERIKLQTEEQLKNRVLLEELMYCYEMSVGYERERIGSIITYFEQAINDGKIIASHKRTKLIENIKNNILSDIDDLDRYLELASPMGEEDDYLKEDCTVDNNIKEDED